MLRTTEIEIATSEAPSDTDTFQTDVAWAICSTYHKLLKASPGEAVFCKVMLFDIPYLTDWKRIADYRQLQSDLIMLHEKH